MQNLADALRLKFPHSSGTKLKQLVSTGRVTINGRRAAKLTQPLQPTDDVQILPRSTSRPILAPLEKVFEDADLLVVNKPAGLLTSTVPREKRPTALAIVRNYLSTQNRRTPVGLIHRLDRDASGLLVFSKSELAYKSLKTQFFKHTVQRIYIALVHGKVHPPKARIESNLIETTDGTVHSTRLGGKGRHAITDYQLLRQHGNLAQLRLRLHTGRKHQIRAHLSERGWPIVGDKTYGASDDAPRLMLAAVELTFTHPRTGKSLTFQQQPPPEMEDFLIRVA